MPQPSQVDIEAIVQRALDERARQGRRRFAAIGSVGLVCVAAALWGAPALAQVTCSQTLPSGLVTLCPNGPALAGDVNANFQQLVNWLTQKVGTQGSPTVTLSGNLIANGQTSLQATTASSLTVNNLLTANSNATINGSMTVIGTTFTNATVVNASGGNVPHACVTRRGPAGSYQANCTGNEIAVGGGGRCDSLWRLTESLPWAGPNDGDGPPATGAVARSWRSVCQVWGNNGAYAYPQQGPWVICCQY